MHTIQTKIQLHYRYLIFLLGCCGVFVVSAYLFFSNFAPGSSQSFVFMWAGIWLAAYVLMMIFMAYIIKKLTKRAVFAFGEQLSIQIFNIKTGNLLEDHLFNYVDIQSCLLSPSRSPKRCIFNLYLLNGKCFKSVLCQDKVEDPGIVSTVGIKIFEQLVSMNPDIKRKKFVWFQF